MKRALLSNASHVFLESVSIVTMELYVTINAIGASAAWLSPNSGFYRKVAQVHGMQGAGLLCSKKPGKAKDHSDLKTI